jgi:hypothetical protein
VLDERTVGVVPVGDPVPQVVGVDRREHGELVLQRLADPGVVAEQRALDDPVGGDVGQVRAGVEARVEVHVAVGAVAQVGVHRRDVRRDQVARRVEQRQCAAGVRRDADLPGEPVAVVPLRLVAVVVGVQPGQLVEYLGADRRVALQFGGRSGTPYGERDLVEMLVRRAEVRVAGAERQTGERLGRAGAIHRGQPGAGGLVHRGELRGDLRARVGLGGAGEDAGQVGEQLGGTFDGWNLRSPGGAGCGHGRGMDRGQQRGGRDERQQAAATELHDNSRAEGKNLTVRVKQSKVSFGNRLPPTFCSAGSDQSRQRSRSRRRSENARFLR